jgi:WXG100 family type VII secretion target
MPPPSPAPAPSPSPGPSPKPPAIHRSFNIWNPGGDPGAIRQAAQAWRTLASDLRTAQHDVGQQVSSLRSGWTGQASDAFQHWGTQLGTDIADSAGQCDRIAGQLDQVADKIQSTNDQIHGLIVAMGVTAAVGIGLTIFTLGFSDAAAAGAATAEAAEAATLVTILTNFLEGLLGRWVVAFAINLFATGVEKAWVNPNHDPFSGWTPDDITHALYGADALVVFTPISEAIPGFGAFKSAHPFIAAGTVSGTAAGVSAFGSDLSALAFEGKPLGLGTLVDVGISAGVSGLVSGAAELGAARFALRPQPTLRGPRLVSTETSLSEPGITFGDAPRMEVTAGGELRPAAPPPEGWTRSAGGLLVPKGTSEVTVGDQTFRVQGARSGEPGVGEARVETPGLRVEQTPGSGLVRATPEGPPGVRLGDQGFRTQEPGRSGLVEARAEAPKEVTIGGRTYRLDSPQDPNSPLVAKAKLPQQPGIAADQWEGHGPGGLTLPKDEAFRTSLGVTVEQPRVTPLRQLWIDSKQLRKSTFKLQFKGGSNTALNPFASGTTPPPPSFPDHPVTAPGQAPAPPPPPPRPPVVGGGTYRVRPGDNLWAIAQRTYGDGQFWHAIYRANMGLGHDPNLIRVGDLIHLPPVVKPAA